MGAETSTSHLVFFIAATTIAVAAAGIMSSTVGDLSAKLETRGADVGDRLATDFRIANDAADVPNNPVLVYVKNTGKTTLALGGVSLFIDGQVQTTTKTVVDVPGATEWRPGEVLQMSVALNLANGDHTIRVVAENGAADDLKVRVG